MRSRCSPCVCVCVSPLSLLGNGSVKVPLSMLDNGYVFYAVRVVSKESRRLVLPRTSCFFRILLLRKEGSPYFRVVKNKYEENYYEEF
jgi:hypothetical protein